MNTLKRSCFLLLVLLTTLPVAAQRPVPGVVWEVPDEAQAVRDLLWMRQIGVQAVRTGVVESERLLGVADSLGLQLYQDLPVSSLSAAALQDSLTGAVQLLNRIVAKSRAHPSAR